MNIIDLRKETGLSQSNFANIFDMPVRLIQSWEQGYRKPKKYILVMMQKILEYEGYISNSGGNYANN